MTASEQSRLDTVRASVRSNPADQTRKGIREVARQLEVTPRTLRFYEDKGLIHPERVGNTRIYSKREVGRMQIILRGKRLGFTIREIKEFIDLYDADPEHIGQVARLAAYVRARLIDLEKQRTALEQTIRELKQIERETEARLAAVGAGKDIEPPAA